MIVQREPLRVGTLSKLSDYTSNMVLAIRGTINEAISTLLRGPVLIFFSFLGYAIFTGNDSTI